MSLHRRAFLRNLSLSALGFYLPQGIAAKAGPVHERLPRGTPESQGVSSEAILAFLDAVEKNDFELHSFMMLRHGNVIAEGWWDPYGPEFVHAMYSMSKSFTSTAVGFAVAEGKISVEDKVVSFFPDDLPERVSENLAALRIKDLLTMSVGNEKEPTQPVVKSENWVRTFLAQNLIHQPGTVFMYNSAATYMCSAIVQKVTGEKMIDYLTPRLFAPLGIIGMKWETCPLGINTGGWGLSIQSEGMAKFGQLYLQKGQWNGKQILPASWIEDATTLHIQQSGEDKPDRPKAKNDWLQGYGYQFWRCQHGHYRGDGAFGQFTIVLPEYEAVIVMTSENKNMQGQLDLVWEHLLPAMKGKSTEQDTGLAARLKELKLIPVEGSAESPHSLRISGKTIALEPNVNGFTTAGFTFGKTDCTLTLSGGEGAPIVITSGMTNWHHSTVIIPDGIPRLISGGRPKEPLPSKLAASAAWNGDTLNMMWRYYETPHHDHVTCEFQDNVVTIRFLSSIAAMKPNSKDYRLQLVGRMD
ncbi:CubicO group peptidase (beta-lactamase class C family) [Prosthecobacter fusiformis]|uniref:CubicO group peptidase (Beta-lactamase class C family) n=1 Tax=Prosthecobacter fusiformis TaxID=48464 RepID=A0A4R7RUD9_9BACT|nr:serine hydrolase [Prosthecobacter fusiformis]TDU69271.1 CubicO group peptidase (beta-lactamase class C family) [Prosthecobacter fusiformis]